MENTAQKSGLFTGIVNPRNLRADELSGRLCCRCAVHKPADEFNLRVGPRRDGTRALYSACKACASAELKAIYEKTKEARSESNKAYRLKNAERYKAYDATPERRKRRVSLTRQETCKSCGAVGGEDQFFSRSSWRDTCKSCRAEDGKAKARSAREEAKEERARRKTIEGQAKKVCTSCGYTGKQAEFYSNRLLRDTCEACRKLERKSKIGEGHAKRLRAEPLPPEKVCTGCGVSKDASEYRLSKTKHKAHTLVPMCRTCETLKRATIRSGKSREHLQDMHRAQVAARRLRDSPQRAQRASERARAKAEVASRKEKPCVTCKEVKKLEFFSKCKGMLDGHGSTCKSCQAAEASRRRALDPEGYLEKMRERNIKDRSKSRMVQETRKAALQHPQWSDKHQISSVFAEAEYMTKLTGQPYAVDHIWPLKNPTVCGLHVACNLRVIPKRLNSKKLNKLPGFLRDQLWDPEAQGVFHEEVDMKEATNA